MTDLESAYVNDAGRPILRESIVAFIDILGFSHLVTSSALQDDAQHVLDTIYAAVQDSRGFVRTTLEEREVVQSAAWVVKFFSDNLALGYPIDEGEDGLAGAARLVIRASQRYQLSMALNGLFLRGALTVGPICLTDEIIFGSSLIECYQLESKMSIVPRVILTEPLWKALANAPRELVENPAGNMRQSICCDVDGWWFVNYLQSACTASGVNWDFVERHKRSILESLARTTRHDILPKFGWACRYHNVFCHWHRDDSAYSDRYRIDRIDEQSTINRLDDLNESDFGSG